MIKKIIIILVLFILISWNIFLNIKTPIYPSVKNNLISIPISNNIHWPAGGETALGILNMPKIISHGTLTKLPVASTAKLITPLSVLSIKPLSLNQTGPIITLSANDVAIYNNYLKEQGSVVKVVAGETISEYQVLEAMLLPSANNMADSLAIWAFGSLPNYASYANKYLQKLGIDNTHVGLDASGFDPSTTSTAPDLVKIGELVMKNPVLAQIVAMPTANNIPVVNTVQNINFLLGSNNIIGIKTGNTNQAGGVFISASKVLVNGKLNFIITARLGAPDLYMAMMESNNLIISSQKSFMVRAIINSNQTVATYHLPWGGQVNATPQKTITTTTWLYNSQNVTINLNPIKIWSTNQSIGTAIITQNSFHNYQTDHLKLTKKIKPPIWWLIFHINL